MIHKNNYDIIHSNLIWSLFMIKRRHFIIVISILLICFIVGSFLDLQIAEAVFVKNDFTGLLFASFGTYPCYMGMAFLGGGLLLTTIKRKDLPLWGKIFSFFLSALAYFLSIFIAQKDLPSVNGFNNPDLTPVSYAICISLSSATFIFAYFVCKKGDPKFLWNIIMVMAVVYIIGMIPVSYIIKAIIHRPRYRFLVRGDLTEFHNWWETCSNYNDFLDGTFVFEGNVITKEEFKSFPSGHSAAGAIMMMVLPGLSSFFKKLNGKETQLFYIGFVWALACMFFRLLVGAHFLTDTCMGSLIVVVVYFIFYEFAKRKKLLNPQQIQEQ